MSINWKNIFLFWALLISGAVLVTLLNKAIGFQADSSVTPVVYAVHVASWILWGVVFAAGLSRLPFTRPKTTP